MNDNDKIEQGKNGLRSYQFESVQKNKQKSYYDDYERKRVHYTVNGLFYIKKCVYCSGDFGARRVDTAFCCQGCQKAHLRLRKKFA